MTEQTSLTKNEKTLAGLAHGSILLGLFTNGVGGIVAALVIWLIKKEKSAYVAAQALQSLVYQAATFFVIMLAWCCWGIVYTVMIMVPVLANPGLYDNTLPSGFWAGLALIAVPLGLWGLTILYGLYGALRSYSGHDFKYAVIGKWLDSQT